MTRHLNHKRLGLGLKIAPGLEGEDWALMDWGV